jgi:hypothetical protein
MTPAEQQRWRELGEAIAAAALNLHQQAQKSPSSPTEKAITEKESDSPQAPPTIRAELQFPTDLVRDYHSSQVESQKLRRRNYRVQFGLFVATTLAFLAAAYYACIAARQHRTMEKQWHTMEAAIAETRSVARENAARTDMLIHEAIKQSGAAINAAEAAKSQAEISKRSAEAAEAALRVTEAADLEPDSIRCTGTPLGLNTEVEVYWKNNGKTRADRVQTAFFVSTPKLPYRLQGLGNTSTIGAGAVSATGPLRVGNVLGGLSEMEMVNQGRIPLYVWGWAKYRDAFGHWHLVIFDYRYRPKTSCDFEFLWVSHQ